MIGMFSSCLLYTCKTAYYNLVAAVKREHHLPGQCSSLNSTDPETIPFDQRLGRRIFPPVNLEQATFDCSSSSQIWVYKRLTLASVVQHLRLSRRNRPAFLCFCFLFFCVLFSPATLQNFSYQQVCSPHTMRVQAKGNNCIKPIF